MSEEANESDYTMTWEVGDDGALKMTFTTDNPETFERLRRAADLCGFTITHDRAPAP